MKLVKIIILCMLLITSASSGIIAQNFNHYAPIPYDSIMHVVYQLEEESHYEKARDLLVSKKDDYPEHWFDIAEEIVYLNKKTGRVEDNLWVFQEGHSRGYFFFLRPEFESCQGYREFDAFNKIVEDDQKLRQKAIKDSKVLYEVILPEEYDSTLYYPMLIVLHGGGSSIERAKKHWKSSQLDRNFIMVFMQSYLYYSSDTYGWKRYDPRAREEILNCYREIESFFSADTGSIIISGISAGATMAMDLYVNQIIPASAILAFSPSKPQEFNGIAQNENTLRNARAIILIGENDSSARFSAVNEMMEGFNKLDLYCKVQTIPGLGHAYPDNFKYWLEYGIEQILNSKTP